MSDHATQFEETVAQDGHRQTWTAAILIAAIAGLAVTLAGAAQWTAAPHCRLHPRPVLAHWQQAPTATSRGGGPCLIAANNSDARVESLEIVTAPSNGFVATRGKNRLVYFPNADFKGVDSFEMRLIRRTDTKAVMTTNITMTVKVD